MHRSGLLPQPRRAPWRNVSTLHDGLDWRIDLTGGYFDAGDYLKCVKYRDWSPPRPLTSHRFTHPLSCANGALRRDGAHKRTAPLSPTSPTAAPSSGRASSKPVSRSTSTKPCDGAPARLLSTPHRSSRCTGASIGSSRLTRRPITSSFRSAIQTRTTSALPLSPLVSLTDDCTATGEATQPYPSLVPLI